MSIPTKAGDLVGGRYRVERVLGEGGMGVVVAARHTSLNTPVAIKFMRPEVMVHNEAAARFMREARAAARLRSEHTARVTDYGTLPSGEPYLVGEYLEGEDLGERLERDGPVPYRDAACFILQACEALQEAHDAGIVHRDIKPSNLFLTQAPNGRPTIKVLDFGISKVSDDGGSLAETSTNAMLGSPFYMSPEQLRSAKDVDARADIWSLGVTLFELISGHLPFEADSIMDLCLLIAKDTAPPVSQQVGHVPAGLQAVLHRCLERDPQKRFASTRELGQALMPFASESKMPVPPDEASESPRAVELGAETLHFGGAQSSEHAAERDQARSGQRGARADEDGSPATPGRAEQTGTGTKLSTPSGAPETSAGIPADVPLDVASAETAKSATDAPWASTRRPATSKKLGLRWALFAAAVVAVLLLVLLRHGEDERLAAPATQPEDTAAEASSLGQAPAPAEPPPPSVTPAFTSNESSSLVDVEAENEGEADEERDEERATAAEELTKKASPEQAPVSKKQPTTSTKTSVARPKKPRVSPANPRKKAEPKAPKSGDSLMAEPD